MFVRRQKAKERKGRKGGRNAERFRECGRGGSEVEVWRVSIQTTFPDVLERKQREKEGKERKVEWSVECVRGCEMKVLLVSIQTDIFPLRPDQSRPREEKKGSRSG